MSSFLLWLGHNRLTGISTFNVTLAEQLRLRGHQVAIAILRKETPYPLLQRKLSEAKLLATSDPRTNSSHTHRVYSDVLTLREDASFAGKRLFVAHGLGEELLEPTAEDVAGIEHLFCVSPFMHRHYQAKFPQLSSSFLPNLIDTRRFAFSPSRAAPRMVLVNDRRTSNAYLDRLLALSKKLRLLFVPVSELNFGYSVWEMEKVLPKFDVVLAYGRSAYEAMSCGRNVIVFGQNGGDGAVTPESFSAMFDRNCSGWATRKLAMNDPDVWERLAEEIARFDPNAGAANRQLAVESVDAGRYIDGFLSAC